MAKDLDVPFLVLSQLSRASETAPGRSQAAVERSARFRIDRAGRGSGGFIYREEVYKKDREDMKGLADLIIAKQRNGPIGTVPLTFLGQYTRFENRAEDLPDEPME